MQIYLKKDYMQYTGSFKERGARYTLLMLSEEQRKRGVVSASAGNHAQAMAYHGGQLGVPVFVVMPVTAPIMKIENCKRYGATVVIHGAHMGEARMHGLKLAKEKGMLYVNGFDHPHILAGQGTCGLEILEQVPDVDAVVIPVGGGGLLAGCAVALKTMKPDVQIIVSHKIFHPRTGIGCILVALRVWSLICAPVSRPPSAAVGRSRHTLRPAWPTA